MADSSPDRMDPLLNFLNERPREAWEWSFAPYATDFSAVNALALFNAALLAYSDGDGIRHFLEKWLFSAGRILTGSGTQGFVARRDETVFVSFRGTNPLDADNWLADVRYQQRKLLPIVPGFVHGGFASLLEEVIQPMLDAVAEFSRDQTPRLFITGHSMGGALAVLAAAVLHFEAGRTASAVYTYGQPRVGDQAFSSAFDDALGTVTFRVVNDLDIVPHLPPVRLPETPRRDVLASLTDSLRTIATAPSGVHQALGAIISGQGFAHVGQLRLFLRDGSVTSDALEWQAREVVYTGTLTELFRSAPSLLRAALSDALRPQDRLLDHDPLRGYLPKLEAQVSAP